MTPAALRLIGTELSQIAAAVARLETYESERDHLRGHYLHRVEGEINTLRQSIEDDVKSVCLSLGLAVERAANEDEGAAREPASASVLGCIICANGNDLPEGETCQSCGREGEPLSPLAAAVLRARGGRKPPTPKVGFA